MKIFFAFLLLSLGGVARADYPVNCQLKMLSTVMDEYKQRYFDDFTKLFSLDNLVFGVDSSTQRPYIIFNSKQGFVQARECKLVVTMQKPLEALGCPNYVIDNLSNDCAP